MSNKDAVFIAAGMVLAFIIGILAGNAIATGFEEKSCKELESRININLAYTPDKGCQLASDL